MIDKIKEISIYNVLDKLWIEYNKRDRSIAKTDGWKIHETENAIVDFTHDRPQGNPFTFVRDYLKLTDHETYKWFAENFGLFDETEYKKKSSSFNWDTSKKTTRDVQYIREHTLELLSTENKEYLKSRCIDYELVKDFVKDFKWGVGVLLYNENWKPVSIVSRLKEGDTRFQALAWASWNWVYMHEFDKEKKKVYVVEWLFDFLSLRQVESNVIGLKNWKVWIEILKKLDKAGYDIVFLPDNDEKWKDSLVEMKNNIENLYVLPYKYYAENVKDVNDMLLRAQGLNDLPILNAVESLINYINKYVVYAWKWNILDIFMREKKPKTPLLYTEINKYIWWWVEEGSYITIWAWSWTWKTRFVNTFIVDFLKKNKQCMIFNLEQGTRTAITDVVSQAVWKKLEDKDIVETAIELWFAKNLRLYTDVRDINHIWNIIKKYKPFAVAIDHVQLVTCGNKTGYEMQVLVAQEIRQIARETGTAIFAISQLSNETIKRAREEWEEAFLPLKWGGHWYDNSDIIVDLIKEMGAEPNERLVLLDKNRYWLSKIAWEIKFDWYKFNDWKKRTELNEEEDQDDY